MRLGLIGLHLETTARNPLRSTAASFAVHRGEEAWAALAADAIVAALGHDPPELVPIWYARARPGGRLDPADAERLSNEMRAALAATGPLDGLLLAQHGGLRIAAAAHDAEAHADLHAPSPNDGEARVVATCREVLGADVPIVACYDPHGDPGDRALSMLDGACAFRTAPHVDVVETRVRATRLLIRIAREGWRPSVRLLRGSLLLPGAVAEGPGAGAEAFVHSARMRDLPGVLDASWLPASPWTDRPDERPREGNGLGQGAGAGFMVVAEDEATALRVARDANATVEGNAGRFRLRDRLIGVDDAARRAADAADAAGTTSSAVPTLLLDAGDALGAGAVGDRWEVALALVGAGARETLVAGIVAPALVARCRAAGDGATLMATVGPELTSGADAPDAGRRRDACGEGGRGAAASRRVELRVVRASIDIAAFVAEGDADGLPPAPGDAALVALGGVHALVRSTRREIADWAELERIAGPLWRWRTVVVKATRRPAGYPVEGRAWTVASPGATDHRAHVAAG